MSRPWVLSSIKYIPILFVALLCTLWNYEQNLRGEIQAKIDNLDQVVFEVENDITIEDGRLKIANEELRLLDQELTRSNKERRSLIEQLGRRDTHIHKLLTQLIQILPSGNVSGGLRQYEIETSSQSQEPIDFYEEKVMQNKNLSGKISKINEKYKFIIINLGQSQGISAKDKFNILNEKGAIATAEIETSYSNYSSAILLSGSFNQIKPDLTVVKVS